MTEIPRRTIVRVDAEEAIRRLLIGSLLGFVWYFVLLIPEGTRLALVEDRAWWRMLVLMVVASALVSLLLPVACMARHTAGRVFTVVALPAILALFYAELVLLFDLALTLPKTDLSVNPNGPFSALFGIVWFVLGSFFLGAPITAAVAYGSSILITLPMGFVHVQVLRRRANGRLVVLGRQGNDGPPSSRACAAPPAG